MISPHTLGIAWHLQYSGQQYKWCKQYRKTAIWLSLISVPIAICFGRQSMLVRCCQLSHQTIKLQDWHYHASIMWCINQLWPLSVSACYDNQGLVKESSGSVTSSTAALFFCNSKWTSKFCFKLVEHIYSNIQHACSSLCI